MDVSNVQEITVAQATDIIKNLPTELSIMMWGAPGIGKTFSLINTFEPLGYRVIPVLAGCSEPTDFTGIPFNAKDAFARYLAPEWAYLCSTEAPKEHQGPTILLLDDVVTAHEQTQAALFKMVHERCIGSLKFRDNVRIIAAGNRIDDRSAAQEMPMALGNRFVHLHIKVDVDTWVEWARLNSIHPTIVSYLRTQPHRISTFEDALDTNCKSFATPRSWEMLSKTLFALEDWESEQIFPVVTGIVGPVGIEFLTHYKSVSKLVPPQEIVKNPKKAKVPAEKDIDILHATVSALEHFILKKENNKHWLPILQYALRLPTPEIAILLAKSVWQVLREGPREELHKASMTDELREMWQRWEGLID